MLKILIPLPRFEKQEKIANYFTSLDTEISNEEKKLEEVKSYKKSMLQQFFTTKSNPLYALQKIMVQTTTTGHQCHFLM